MSRLTYKPTSLGSSKLVIVGGLAELFSGAISMGLGAYLAAVTERDHYTSEEKRERDEVCNKPDDEKEEIYEIMARYGITREATKPVVDDLARNPEEWIKASAGRIFQGRTWLTRVQFMMDFELKLEQPNVSRAWISAGTMGLAYFLGR